MTEKNNNIVSSDKKKTEIQQILEEVPEDVLIAVLADKIKREPIKEVKKVIRTVSQTFIGPLPPPSMLADYDSVHPGLADRIVAMAESQQKHRHSFENKAVDAKIKTESRGQHYALIVSLLIIAGSLYLISSGKEIYGSILAGGTLISLATIFITGRKKDKQSSDNNDEPD